MRSVRLETPTDIPRIYTTQIGVDLSDTNTVCLSGLHFQINGSTPEWTKLCRHGIEPLHSWPRTWQNAAKLSNVGYGSNIETWEFILTFETRGTPLQQYIKERNGVLTDNQITQYVMEFSTNRIVLFSVVTSADREASKSLSLKK